MSRLAPLCIILVAEFHIVISAHYVLDDLVLLHELPILEKKNPTLAFTITSFSLHPSVEYLDEQSRVLVKTCQKTTAENLTVSQPLLP